MQNPNNTDIQIGDLAERIAGWAIDGTWENNAEATASMVQERPGEAWLYVMVNGQKFRVTVHEA